MAPTSQFRPFFTNKRDRVSSRRDSCLLWDTVYITISSFIANKQFTHINLILYVLVIIWKIQYFGIDLCIIVKQLN